MAKGLYFYFTAMWCLGEDSIFIVLSEPDTHQNLACEIMLQFNWQQGELRHP